MTCNELGIFFEFFRTHAIAVEIVIVNRSISAKGKGKTSFKDVSMNDYYKKKNLTLKTNHDGLS